jgi:hypothetical protein
MKEIGSFALQASRSTCHGGFCDEFSRPPGNDLFFVLMVLLCFIKHVFWLVSMILYKRSVSIDEKNWPFVLRASRLTCHGGFRGEFSRPPGNDIFFLLLMVLFSFIEHVFRLAFILHTSHAKQTLLCYGPLITFGSWWLLFNLLPTNLTSLLAFFAWCSFTLGTQQRVSF